MESVPIVDRDTIKTNNPEIRNGIRFRMRVFLCIAQKQVNSNAFFAVILGLI
jgi:hypothetical protein